MLYSIPVENSFDFGRYVMKFTKMHGIGNDYIYFDCTETSIENPEQLAISLSDRHFGIGGDGIILISRSDVADFKMNIYNADGSQGKMCGNGTRCIGKYVYDKGLTDKTEITLETLSGIKKLKLKVENKKTVSVTVDMGKAEFDCKKIPVIFDKDKMIGERVKVAGKEWNMTCISMGNPHCVVFCEESIDRLPLTEIGPCFENNDIFPERTNTEFVEVLSDTTLKMRVWERGSAETLACGTGACATVVAAVENGYCKKDTDIIVQLLGGNLIIKYMSDNTVLMTGPAEFVFDGEILQE